jgi:predicted HNH restriction endonuclease
METALFINGVFDSVLTEILDAQNILRAEESFLQPHSGRVIQMLKKRAPTPTSPVRLYISTSENLNNICYTAEIIKWEDKRELLDSRRKIILQHLNRFQPNEASDLNKNKAANLITIRNLQKLETQLSTGLLIKTNDNQALKPRTQSGNWSEVYDSALFAITESETEETNNRKLAKGIAESKKLAANVLQKRLETAARIPERVQIISVGFRRNADVIVAVLNRANGICERCKQKAPFIRKSDGTPFLEVHHKITLAKGGEDTVENALALCPNCHRESHYG